MADKITYVYSIFTKSHNYHITVDSLELAESELTMLAELFGDSREDYIIYKVPVYHNIPAYQQLPVAIS